MVGYIASDGNLSSDGHHINITSKDAEHLNLIKEVLLLNNRVGKKSRSKDKMKLYSYLAFGDVAFYKYLLALGLAQRKSLSLGQLEVPADFFLDFLRGVIDGDGNISSWIHRTNHNRQWCLRIFSGSSRFLEWLRNENEKRFCLKGLLYSSKRGGRDNPIFTLRYGKKAAAVILKLTYSGDRLALKRKHIQAKLCLQDTLKVIN